MLNAYRILMGKPQGMRSRGRRKRIWGYNIAMELKEIGYELADRVPLTQGKEQWWSILNLVMKINCFLGRLRRVVSEKLTDVSEVLTD
jgi:hypothetical protein